MHPSDLSPNTTGMHLPVLLLSIRNLKRFCYPRFVLESIKYFSVGVGLSFVHASGVFFEPCALIPFRFNATFRPEGTVRVTDTADAFAYNLGFLVKPTDNLKLGLSYRSRVDLDSITPTPSSGARSRPRR